jgi:hypothetical protein
VADGSDPDRGFARFATAPDGLRLHIRSYKSRVSSVLPVVCLPARPDCRAAQSKTSLVAATHLPGRCGDCRSESHQALSCALSALQHVRVKSQKSRLVGEWFNFGRGRRPKKPRRSGAAKWEETPSLKGTTIG